MPDDSDGSSSPGHGGLWALAEFRRALNRYTNESNALVKRYGLTPQQFAVLLAVGGSPAGSLSVSELADELSLTHNATVELSQRAEASGLLTRVTDASNARRTLLELTGDGWRVLNALVADHVRELVLARSNLVTALAHWSGEMLAFEGRAGKSN